MHNGLTPRRLMAVAFGALAGFAVTPALALADGPFDPTCNGRISLGEDRTEGQTNYFFACSDDVKGYAIVTLNRETSGFDTEPVVLLPSGDPAPTGQSFSCSGPIPGDGVSCAGSALAGNKVTGFVNLTDDPCVGKRPEVALIVSNAAGATAGPFRLVNAKNGPAYRPIDGCPLVKPKAKRQRRAAALRRHR
jgi:hypothetical protein